MKKLEEILDSVQIVNDPQGLFDEVTGVFIDSRDCIEGSLFIAISGSKMDGHDYISDAVSNGASHVVLDNPDHVSKTSAIMCWWLILNRSQVSSQRIIMIIHPGN